MTREQAALLDKSNNNLEAALMLLAENYPEIAVSRAYYAMFYAAEALLLGEGLAFSKHSAVIAEFGRVFVKTGRISPEYHRTFRDAQDFRNISDYDLSPSLDEQQAKVIIDHASDFVRMTESILKTNGN